MTQKTTPGTTTSPSKLLRLQREADQDLEALPHRDRGPKAALIRQRINQRAAAIRRSFRVVEGGA